NELTLYGRDEPPQLEMQFKQPNNRPNEYHETTVNPNQFKNPDQMLAFEAELRKAAAKQPQTW
ncbi:MAG TPA: hypothetical protein VLH08_13970, partial [Acidobacteriota bacterium]|nr:hypothetical protein [Acidobacteriota bacterium]